MRLKKFETMLEKNEKIIENISKNCSKKCSKRWSRFSKTKISYRLPPRSTTAPARTTSSTTPATTSDVDKWNGIKIGTKFNMKTLQCLERRVSGLLIKVNHDQSCWKKRTTPEPSYFQVCYYTNYFATITNFGLIGNLFFKWKLLQWLANKYVHMYISAFLT
jgi:hypothetical protein